MGKPRILVVEDTKMIANVIFDLLSPTCDVTLCFTGKEGVAKALESRFDLVVTDLVMPDTDGLSLAKILRQNEVYKTAPILALTAQGKHGLPPEAEPLFDAYLIKPFGIEDLPAVAARLLAAPPRRAAAKP